MKYKPHFDTDTQQAEKMGTLLADLHAVIAQLEQDIAAEEDQTGQHDPAHYAYPFTARMMRSRRDNLKATVAALDQRVLERT
jgi:hypothetical protein